MNVFTVNGVRHPHYKKPMAKRKRQARRKQLRRLQQLSRRGNR